MLGIDALLPTAKPGFGSSLLKLLKDGSHVISTSTAVTMSGL
jgi:hypothetical protein